MHQKQSQVFFNKLTVKIVLHFDNFVLTNLVFSTNKYLETFFFFFLRGEGLVGVGSVYLRADNDFKVYFPCTWIINRTSLSGCRASWGQKHRKITHLTHYHQILSNCFFKNNRSRPNPEEWLTVNSTVFIHLTSYQLFSERIYKDSALSFCCVIVKKTKQLSQEGR